MAKLPHKVSAVPRRPREAVRTAPSGTAGLYVGRARGRRRLQQQPRELRGGNDGHAPSRPGRDGSPRASRLAGEGLSEGEPSAGLGRVPAGGQSGGGPRPSAAGQLPSVCW